MKRKDTDYEASEYWNRRETSVNNRRNFEIVPGLRSLVGERYEDRHLCLRGSSRRCRLNHLSECFSKCASREPVLATSLRLIHPETLLSERESVSF
jgi:hypothetical protein